MNQINKKKVIIGVMSVAIVVSMGFSIYTSRHMNDKPDVKTTQKTSQVADKNTSNTDKNADKTAKKQKPVIHLNPMNGKEDTALSQDKKDLSLAEINSTKDEVRNLYSQFKFDEGVQKLNDLADTSKLTGDAEILKKLQIDGSLCQNLQNDNPNDTVNGIAFLNIMQNFQDPEDLLLAMLHLDSKIRPYVIEYDGSLNPIIPDGVTPDITSQTTEPVPYEVNILYPDTKVFHKITFSLQGNLLEAYICEYKDGSLHFYMINDPTGKANYYTVGQWKKINDNEQKGLPAMQGVLEMKAQSETMDDINNQTSQTEVQAPTDGTTPANGTTSTDGTTSTNGTTNSNTTVNSK